MWDIFLLFFIGIGFGIYCGYIFLVFFYDRRVFINSLIESYDRIIRVLSRVKRKSRGLTVALWYSRDRFVGGF